MRERAATKRRDIDDLARVLRWFRSGYGGWPDDPDLFIYAVTLVLDAAQRVIDGA